MTKHPCPYPVDILEFFQTLVRPGAMLLDNMAGTGGIHKLEGCHTFGIELEPEWASAHPRNILGDATALPFSDNSFDDIFVSCAYGNRMSDQYLPPATDTSKRYTYAVSLGRKLDLNSGARYKFNSTYKDIHINAWYEAARVLKSKDFVDHPDGQPSRLVLNIKDFFIKGERQPVVDWHVETLKWLGFNEVHRFEFELNGLMHSPNRQRDNEKVIVFSYDK